MILATSIQVYHIATCNNLIIGWLEHIKYSIQYIHR